jgi:ribose transport system permease protein
VSTDAAPALGGGADTRERISTWANQRRSKLALSTVIVLLAAYTASQSSIFLTWSNIQNVLVQCSVIGILAVGMTFLMVSGGIDLSVGSGVSLAGVVMAKLMASGTAPVEAVALAMALAVVVGLFTGALAAWSPTHPFILTLGMLALIQGVALLVSTGPVTELPNSFIELTAHKVFGLPMVIVVFAVVALLGHLLLKVTKLGRWLYAIGSSETAAYLAGIPIKRVKILIYGVSGLLVAVAAVLLSSQLASAQPEMGNGLELSAIAAVAVGGTPLSGGRGDIAGTLLGVLLLALIGNALNLLSVSSNWQYVLQGAVIITAVMAQRGDA